MKITQPSGRRQPGRADSAAARRLARRRRGRRRLVLVAWDDVRNHAALAAAAAAPQPHGVHETIGSILATGGIIVALAVTGIVFAITTLRARRRQARSAASLYPPAAPRRRSRASARW